VSGEGQELEMLKHKIHQERGFNCHFYKEKCLRRRIAVRMRARGQESFRAYTELLDRDPTEYDRLLDTLTINVTKFFRNYDMWAALEQEVLPHLFERAGVQKIWSAGSASGEEAYSLSILLHEWAEKHDRMADLRRFRIIGTDIDRYSLDAARLGEYPELSFGEMPAPTRERWFSPGPPYRIHAEARRNVSFVHRDLLSNDPEHGHSLILCRNVIIYFDRETQEQLFNRFYEALAPGGFLVLGKVETLLGCTRSLFRSVSNRERVFQKPE
jgi:chemotaxis protein methyltransferase CheR